MAVKLKIDRKYYLMENELNNPENPDDPNLVKFRYYIPKRAQINIYIPFFLMKRKKCHLI